MRNETPGLVPVEGESNKSSQHTRDATHAGGGDRRPPSLAYRCVKVRLRSSKNGYKFRTALIRVSQQIKDTLYAHVKFPLAEEASKYCPRIVTPTVGSCGNTLSNTVYGQLHTPKAGERWVQQVSSGPVAGKDINSRVNEHANHKRIGDHRHTNDLKGALLRCRPFRKKQTISDGGRMISGILLERYRIGWDN
ncbi:hypothetical protein EVAR_25362_1 [Eumeta japonica]|uniref:Uncharacterized protein n=1 Tax=Eumeta variegata TaxID=151549 RepID=A0A4C1XWQ0_EUMVA|nr:hypothetical protein EVAR_25362_1 [Eumeta japonica]